MHASTDAVLALATLNENGLPPDINAPLDDSDSVIWNVAADAAGAVKKNVKLVPPPTVTSDGVPLPPDVYVGAWKSAEMPLFTPLEPSTVTVHEIASFTRTIVVNPFTCPTHDSTDAVVGTPNTPNVNGLPAVAL